MPRGLILLVQFGEKEILVTRNPKWGSHDYHMTLIDQGWGDSIGRSGSGGLRFLELGFEALGFQGFKACEFAGLGGQGGCEVQSYGHPRRMTHVLKRPSPTSRCTIRSRLLGPRNYLKLKPHIRFRF